MQSEDGSSLPGATGRVQVPGSERQPRPSFKAVRRADAEETVRLVIKVRPKNELPDPEVSGAQPPRQRATTSASYETHSAMYGADPADIESVTSFARAHGLKVVETSAEQRLVVLTGTVKDAEAAFSTELHVFESKTSGETYRGRTGPAHIPASLQGIVTAVTGLDNRVQAKPQAAIGALADEVPEPISYTPPQLARIYGFPQHLDGAGQCVGLLEFGGGYNLTDLKAYCHDLGVAVPRVTAVSVDGTRNRPGIDRSADFEVMLDIEVVAGIAPQATIAVYFAKFTEAGWIEAITKAIHDQQNRPSVLSISWGWPEFEQVDTLAWTPQVMDEVNRMLKEAAQLNITVIVAAGDDGSIDGFEDGKAHVDFPSSSPYVLGCGGTTLIAENDEIVSEVVWSDGIRNGGRGTSGGGVSDYFPIPAWQSSPRVQVPPSVNSGFAGRGVPDVAANADGRTGYLVRVAGQTAVSGGTSASAPLWAGLIALINQQLARSSNTARVGYFNPLLYQSLGASAAFRDITSGTNDALGTLHGAYTAGPGWDACTGWGSPNGTNLLLALTGQSLPHAPLIPGPWDRPAERPRPQPVAEPRMLKGEGAAAYRKLVDTLHRLVQLMPEIVGEGEN